MSRSHIIKFRATDQDEARLDELKKQTGLTTSDLLRQLLHSAELQPISRFRPVARLSTIEKSIQEPTPA